MSRSTIGCPAKHRCAQPLLTLEIRDGVALGAGRSALFANPLKSLHCALVGGGASTTSLGDASVQLCVQLNGPKTFIR